MHSTREHTNTMPHPPAMDPVSPEQRRPRIPNTSPARGLEGLSHMAKTPPPSSREKKTAPDNFAESVRRRVEVDIAELDLTRIQITKTNRFPSKMKPTKALAQLPSIEAMSDVYKTTYEIYLKRFNKLLQNVNPKSKPGKSLNTLCQTLNIDNRSKENQDLPSLLARLRASDMMKGPP